MKQQSENLQEIKGDDAIVSGVWPTSAVNDAGTPARSGTQLTQPRSRPVRFDLVDKDGKRVASHTEVQPLGEWASVVFPDQDQDPDRTGRGWDISVVGCDR